MKLFTRIAVLFYVTMVMFLGSVMVLISLNWLDYNHVVDFLTGVYFDKNMRILVGVIGGVLLLNNFLFYRFFTVKLEKGKTIAFDNTAGRVSVSLFAIEDLIKNIVLQQSEVKEARPSVTAGRKGLQVQLRLVLKSDVSIPDVTSKVQELIKRKIQETISLDEPVNVTIHISKIVPEQMKDKRGKDKQEQYEANYPFQGYRA